jgi:AcrR family transcriptional regulator
VLDDQRRSRTRDALLASGAALLRGGALREGLARALTPGDVARGAGRSRQTWYRHFASGGDFADELAAWSLGRVTRGAEPVFTHARRLRVGDPETVTERLRLLATSGFDLHARPGTVLPLLVALALAVEEETLGAPPADRLARAALLRHYDQERQLGALTLAELLASWGRVPAPQLTFDDLVATFAALSEGIAIRHQIDPDRYDARLFADALVLLLPALTVPDASAGARVGPRWDAAPLGRPARAAHPRRSRSAADVMAAARAEFAARGYQQTTIAVVSAASGVSETTIFEIFGSKAGLAAACFAPAIGGLELALRDEADEPVLDRIRHHLERLSGMLHRSLAFVTAWFDVAALDQAPGRAVDPRDPRVVAPVERPLVPLLEEAQAAGVVTTALPARQLAGGITVLALSRVFGYPHEDPAVTAAAVECLALDGAVLPAARAAASA